VLRLERVIQDGAPTYSWIQRSEILDPYADPGELWCRLDLNFLRPGRDAPMPVEAGVVPDRVGVLFCDYTENLKAQDRVVTIAGPVTGTFEIKATPDVAIGFSQAHHIEVAITEISQSLSGRYQFPGK
jgi:hypothetical protein